MRVEAVKSFVGRDGNGQKHIIAQGDVLELPAGVDWVAAGLVTPILEAEAEPAPAPKRRKKADGN